MKNYCFLGCWMLKSEGMAEAAKSKPVIGLSWEPKLPPLPSGTKKGSDKPPRTLPESSSSSAVVYKSNTKLIDGLFVPPNNPKKLNKLLRKQFKDTAGKNWFDMAAQTLTPELKKDLQLLKGSLSSRQKLFFLHFKESTKEFLQIPFNQSSMEKTREYLRRDKSDVLDKSGERIRGPLVGITTCLLPHLSLFKPYSKATTHIQNGLTISLQSKTDVNGMIAVANNVFMVLKSLGVDFTSFYEKVKIFLGCFALKTQLADSSNLSTSEFEAQYYEKKLHFNKVSSEHEQSSASIIKSDEHIVSLNQRIIQTKELLKQLEEELSSTQAEHASFMCDFAQASESVSKSEEGVQTALNLRSVIDPRRHYKKGDSKSRTVPMYFQVGTVIESASDFFTGRLTKKERKATLADELLSDHTLGEYRKRKVREIEEQNRPGGVEKWKIKGGQSWKRAKQRRR
ncbi:unnamed protein product [Camellia sinensis]